MKIVSCHTADSKPVKKEVNNTVTLPPFSVPWQRTWNTSWRERLSTVDLLVKEACFEARLNSIFYMKRSWFKLDSARRSTVLSLPLHQGFPSIAIKSLPLSINDTQHHIAVFWVTHFYCYAGAIQMTEKFRIFCNHDTKILLRSKVRFRNIFYAESKIKNSIISRCSGHFPGLRSVK